MDNKVVPAQVDWSNQLGLSCSQTGRVVYSLTAAVEQARSCVQQASPIYDALGTFGEALGPEMPEEDSLQTPPSLLIELAELIPILSQARQLLRRIDALAGNILTQLAQTQAMRIQGHRFPEIWRQVVLFICLSFFFLF